jgi:hypothetical protein
MYIKHHNIMLDNKIITQLTSLTFNYLLFICIQDSLSVLFVTVVTVTKLTITNLANYSCWSIK